MTASRLFSVHPDSSMNLWFAETGQPIRRALNGQCELGRLIPADVSTPGSVFKEFKGPEKEKRTFYVGKKRRCNQDFPFTLKWIFLVSTPGYNKAEPHKHIKRALHIPH